MYKKGVIPAAGSPTATLLRLHISHSTYSKIACINAPTPIFPHSTIRCHICWVYS